MTKFVTLIKKNRSFFNKKPFPQQLKMAIIGNSGSGKTKLLFKSLLKNYFDFEKVVFASPSLTQAEYEVIIKSL